MSSILCARAARKQTTTSGAATTYYYHHHTVQVTILRPPHAFLDGNDCHHHRHTVQITMHTFSICTIALEKNTTTTTTTQCKLQYHSHHHLPYTWEYRWRNGAMSLSCFLARDNCRDWVAISHSFAHWHYVRDNICSAARVWWREGNKITSHIRWT